MKYLGNITNAKDLTTKEYVDDKTEVVQTLTSGTKIGSVGGTDLYAPSGGGTALTDSEIDAAVAEAFLVYYNITITSGASYISGIYDRTGVGRQAITSAYAGQTVYVQTISNLTVTGGGSTISTSSISDTGYSYKYFTMPAADVSIVASNPK